MEANKILQTDLLDIIFEGRNKSYGAYELRSTYHKRIKQSVIVTGVVCLLFITGVLLANSSGKKMNGQLLVKDYELTSITEPPKKTVIPEPVKPKEVEQVHTIKVTPPRIVEDYLVKEPEVPTNDEAENTKIGLVNTDGVDKDIVAPPVEKEGTGGKIELPSNKNDYEDFPAEVQIEAKFPGGLGAWRTYLERNLNTNMPVDNGAAAGNYTVVVSFVVDKDGNISDVQALNDPGYGTAQEAIRVIKKSKQWTPALQNGRYVTYRQKQSITFVVSEG
ncbi:MAG TPA: energy transducer TonB [Panacibacter sp.]|nr:energy transducer TonB [Panacibacter sp.]